LKPHHKQVAAPKPRGTDIQMYIRDGLVNLRTPDCPGSKRVPEDYLVALGFSMAFRHPQFRKMMLALVHEQYDQGLLSDVIETHRPASTVN
jgi:hypothetical protein